MMKKKPLVIAAVVAIGCILAVGLPLLAHSDTAPWQPERRVLLSQLYAKASAAELPQPGGTTLWQVTGRLDGGPQQKLCSGYDGPAYGQSTDIYYRKDNVSAWYSLGGYPNAKPLMRYSDYASAPAFYDDIFKGSESETVRTMLADAVPTDSQGEPLPAGAAIEAKRQGTYDMYAKLVTSKEKSGKEYLAGCDHLMLHVAIDAASGLYKEISVYKDAVDPANLSFSQTQAVTMSSVNFDQALPVLRAAGFDMEHAKQESSRSTYARLVNREAGFEFSYEPSVIGEPKLTEKRDAAGRVTEYMYTFSGRPDVSTIIRTAASTMAPHTADDMRALAARNGWTITTNSQGDDSHVPGCRAGDTEWYVGAHDQTTEYGLFTRTCGPFPSVYTVMPRALRVVYADPAAPAYTQESSPIAGFSHFAPGGEPSLMH